LKRKPCFEPIVAVCALLVLGTVASAQGQPAAADRPDSGQQQPDIVMPELLEFVSADYPKEAAEKGIEANVVLRLTIDVEGNVEAADVIVPAGNGFDEAARAAALKFKWKPALKDGKPTKVIIEYKYTFELQEVEPPQAEAKAPKAKSKFGNLGGTVTIAGTDIPLAGAQVVVVLADGSEQQLLTDGEGRWELPGLEPGDYTVRVSAPGYLATENTEQVAAGEATEITYRIAPELEGIEVTVQGERPPREVTRRTIEQREIARVPGTGGDALRAIEALPGVTRPPFLAGLLIIRGSDPNDSIAVVDGVEVPLIYHFGGLFSVVPTEAIDRFDLYPGNFSARYGRYMGGLVDVALRSPNMTCNDPFMKPSERQGCYHGLVELDLLNTRFLLEGPIPLTKKKWTFLAAARRSWFDTWLKPVLEAADAGVTSAPVYYDYQLIAETKPREDSKLSIRAFGADDRLELLIKDPLAEDPGFGGNLSFGTYFHQLQLLYEDQLDPSVKLTTMVSVGKSGLNFSFGSLLFDLVYYPIQYRSEFAWKLAETFTLNSGLDFDIGPYDAEVRSPAPPDPGEPDPGPFSSRPPLVSKTKSTAFRPGWYLEGEWTPTERIRFVPGVRLDYARDTSHADVSPRLNARYDIVSPTLDARAEDEPALRTTIKAGIGAFHQPPQFQETDEVFGTPNLISNRAIHYSVGIEQELTKQLEASVEGFYKDLINIVARGENDQGSFTYNNEGSGNIYGVETFLKYKPDKRFFGWLAYTLSRSERKEGPDDPVRLFEYDQTHNLSVLGSYRLGRGWEFGAKFQITSGNLYTPIADAPTLPALYAADAGSYAPIQGELYSRRLPAFHRLDVRVDKRWQFEAWRLAAYLDVRNVYNYAAVESIAYNYDYSKSVRSAGIPILPSLGLRGEF